MRKINVLVLDVEKDRVYTAEIEDDLNTYYNIIGCDLIDIPTRVIGSNKRKKRMTVDIICDDEGTFKSNAKISAVDNYFQPMFVGNLVFAKHNDEGDMVGLTDDEVDFLRHHIMKIPTRNYPEGYWMLTQCEYC